MNTAARVKVEKILHLSVFSGTPIKLFVPENPKLMVSGRVRNVAGKTFEIELENGFQMKHFMEKPLKVITTYRSQALLFNTTILPTQKTPNESIFTFSIDSEGELRNQRSRPRVSLANLDLTAKITFSTQVGEISAETTYLRDGNGEFLALSISRSSGLVLAGDKVIEITLHKNNEIILKSQGTVSRIDFLNSANHSDSYLVVIKLEHNYSTNLVYLKQTEQRKETRVCLLKKPAFAVFSHPIFNNAKTTAAIADISPTGISLLIDSKTHPIFHGLIIREMEIQLPFQARIPVTIQVLNCQRSPQTDETMIRAGSRFLTSSLELAKAIGKLKQTDLNEHLFDATSEDYEGLWELFFESGFIYPEKRKNLQEFASQIFNTYLKLLNSETPILKKILFKDQDGIRGHISAVKFFDDTWIIHHLNAISSQVSNAVGTEMVRALLDFFMAPSGNPLVQNHFISFYYRPNNPFPSIIFGEAKERIADPHKCNTIDFDYCLLRNSPVELNVSKPNLHWSRFPVEEATLKDLYRLEEILVENGHEQIMRIEGLVSSKILKLEIEKYYKEADLYRFRKVFCVTDQETGHQMFAVCNYASPGLNMSELTNSFRLYSSDRGQSQSNELLAEAISYKVCESYKGTDMPHPVYLALPGDPIPNNFEKKKVYRYLYISAPDWPLLKNAIEDCFKDMKSLLRKYGANKGDKAS